MTASHPPPAVPSTPHTHKPGPLWRHLWLWAMATLLAVWLVLTLVAYYTGLHEADEINDGQLLAFAQILLREDKHASPSTPAPALEIQTPQTLYAPKLRAVAWEGERITWDTHGMAAALPPNLPLGLQTLHLPSAPDGPVWRAYVSQTRMHDGAVRRVIVLIDMGWRRTLGRDIAEHVVRPALVLLPLAALLLAWAMRRGLAPLEQLSRDIAALDLNAEPRLPAQQAFQEFSSTVQAINALTARLHAQLERERRFTADVAHELRTPLTSLLLQTRLARTPQASAQQEAALAQVEHDAQRAAHILGQLLDLARAQKQATETAAPVDLCLLAQQVIIAHASMAHGLGQTLALQAPDTPVTIVGHAPMLELALRNLVDNALRHTPPGTLVEVHVAFDTHGCALLAVHDDGARSNAPQKSTPGMGVGLDLAQRIAQAQGAVLEQFAGSPEQPHRMVLRWPLIPG